MAQQIADSLVLASGAVSYSPAMSFGRNNRILVEVLFAYLDGTSVGSTGIRFEPQYSNDLTHWTADTSYAQTGSSLPPVFQQSGFDDPGTAGNYKHLRIKLTNGCSAGRALVSAWATLFSQDT